MIPGAGLVKDIIKEFIQKHLEKNKSQSELNEIIEHYLLPETVNNLYELGKVKSSIPGYPGLHFNIFDVVHSISPDEFDVGNFHFPFLTVKLDFTSFNKVEDRIITAVDNDIIFFKKIYRAFDIVDKKKDLNKFRKSDYLIFHEAINLAFDNKDLENLAINSKLLP